MPYAPNSTTLAVFRATPGKEIRASIRFGTSPPYCSIIRWAAPTMFLALLRKKPVDRT
jgi:hypothetical protein